MNDAFANYFVECLNQLDDAAADAMSARVTEFHRTAPAEAKMPYELYMEFVMALARQSLKQGEEVTVLLDGVSIRKGKGEPLVLPFGVDSAEFAAYSQSVLGPRN